MKGLEKQVLWRKGRSKVRVGIFFSKACGDKSIPGLQLKLPGSRVRVM